MTLSSTAKSKIFKQESDSFLVLIVITHPDLVTPLRFVNNTVNVISNGFEYIAFPFKLKWPNDTDGTVPVASLQIDNSNQVIMQTIRTLVGKPTVSISAIRMDDFDAVEVTLPNFQLSNVRGDVGSITGDLTLDDVAKEAYPGVTFTPAEFPGIFIAV